MRKGVSAATLCLGALWLGACGSAAPTNVASVSTAKTVATVTKPAPLTPAQYSARVNAICRTFKQRRPKVAGGSLTALALEASEDLPDFRASEREEASVPVPPSEVSIVKALRVALRAKYRETAEVPGVAAREGETGLERILPAFERTAGEVVALNHQLGLTECVKG